MQISVHDESAYFGNPPEDVLSGTEPEHSAPDSWAVNYFGLLVRFLAPDRSLSQLPIFRPKRLELALQLREDKQRIS